MPLDDMRAWIGRSQTVEDFLAPWPAKALIATLDEHDPEPRMGDPLPPLWHWLYFLEAAPASRIGPDGHGERGDFLPPIELPRRMWAGSRFSFDGEPLRFKLGVEGSAGDVVGIAIKDNSECEHQRSEQNRILEESNDGVPLYAIPFRSPPRQPTLCHGCPPGILLVRSNTLNHQAFLVSLAKAMKVRA